MGLLDILDTIQAVADPHGHDHTMMRRWASGGGGPPATSTGPRVSDLANRLGALEEQAAAQARTLRWTQCALDVMCDLLEEKGLLDDHIVRVRVEARLEEEAALAAEAAAVAEEARRAKFAALAEGLPPPPEPPGPPVPCARCKAMVPLNQTNITDDGNVCDACFAKG